ncbi:MAG TPA: DNA-processing protein DprA [Longimicrobiales bacterium]|nr:DNA-processing protein DprA [Longimicrobiales bacterium]
MIAGPELRALLHIRAIPGVGDVRLTALLRRHGSARAAWAAIRMDRPDAAAKIRTPAAEARIEHALRSVLDAPDTIAIGAHEPHYPSALFDLHDAPPLIFARGDTGLLDRPAVAIVGTRACTEYGADVARSIADALARAGVVVVSGLAHGVDRHGHEAALDAGGHTVAVIGCGIDVVYPHQHERLHDRIGRDGLLVSEFMPGEPALPHHFPRRNRIIAALSRAVVVVEAPARSGALITADHALDLGREVFAVPGPIGRRTSDGTNALIRDGATVVTTPTDIVEFVVSVLGVGKGGLAARFRPGEGRPRRSRTGVPAVPGSGVGFGPATGGPAAAVEAALSDEPMHVDDLADAARLDPGRTLAALLELELMGRARACSGGRYGRAPQRVGH